MLFRSWIGYISNNFTYIRCYHTHTHITRCRRCSKTSALTEVLSRLSTNQAPPPLYFANDPKSNRISPIACVGCLLMVIDDMNPFWSSPFGCWAIANLFHSNPVAIPCRCTENRGLRSDCYIVILLHSCISLVEAVRCFFYRGKPTVLLSLP